MNKVINSVKDFYNALAETGAYDGSELEAMGYTLTREYMAEVMDELDYRDTLDDMYNAGVF